MDAALHDWSLQGFLLSAGIPSLTPLGVASRKNICGDVLNSEGPCKESTVGNTLPQRRILNKGEHNYLMVSLGTGIFSN